MMPLGISYKLLTLISIAVTFNVIVINYFNCNIYINILNIWINISIPLAIIILVFLWVFTIKTVSGEK